MAHQAGAYPSSVATSLGEFLLSPGREVSHLGGGGTARVKCLTQEHNTMSPARARNPETSALAMRPPRLVGSSKIHVSCERLTAKDHVTGARRV